MSQLESNILSVDFAPRPNMPKPSKRVKAVQQLAASAEAHGVVLVRKPVTLDDKWIEWHKAIVNG